MQKIKIYTFWLGHLPPYIKLCLDTFRNSGYEFVLLDHTNLSDYIPRSELSLAKIAKFPPAAQGDIIAVHMMNRHKGFFIDADTIFFDKINYMEDLLNSHELVMIGDENVPFCHAAFILSGGASSILGEWEEKVRDLLFALENSGNSTSIENAPLEVKPTSFGNPLLSPIIEKRLNEVKILDKGLFLPENRGLREFSSERRRRAYNDFYFRDKKQEIHSAPFLVLHNSWTPEWYKEYSIEDIGKDRLFLSRLLMQAIK